MDRDKLESRIKYRADRDLAFVYIGKKKAYLGRPGTIEYERQKDKALKLLAANTTEKSRSSRKPISRDTSHTPSSMGEGDTMRPYHCNYPLDSLFEDYLNSRKAKKMNSGDLSRIKTIRKWLSEWFPLATGDDFDQFDLEAFRDRVEGVEYISKKNKREKYSRLTINKIVSALKKVLKWGVGEEKFNAGLFAKIALVPELKYGETTARESKKKHQVSDADIAATLPYLRQQYRDIAIIQRVTGMRTGEICELNWDEIDTVTYADKEMWVFEPTHHKNAHRGHKRQIPLPPEIQQILLRYRKNRYYIFLTKEGNKLTTQRIDRKISRAVERAMADGVIQRPWHPYDLRRKRVTQEILKGDLKKAQHIAGHRRLDTQMFYDLTGVETAIEATLESPIPPELKINPEETK